MDALKDTLKLLLVLVGIMVAAYLAWKFWWLALFLIAATCFLLVIKYIVNGRFRE